MSQKAKKNPITIEFIQFNNTNANEISVFVGQPLRPELESETAYVAGIAPPIFSVTIPTLEGNMKAMPGDYIIKGVMGEFYPCKPDVFLASYTIREENNSPDHAGDTVQRPDKNLSFSQALQDLKNGSKLQRAGWNGSGMWVVLVKGENWGIGGKAPYDQPDAPHIKHGDFLGMKTAQNTFEAGWRPTSVDMLAEDWQIAE